MEQLPFEIGVDVAENEISKASWRYRVQSSRFKSYEEVAREEEDWDFFVSPDMDEAAAHKLLEAYILLPMNSKFSQIFAN